MRTIPSADLNESFSHYIADSAIRAALFSTYTFNHAYFEDDILQSLLCGMGQRRGTFPVTVIVDRNRFMGQRSGYDVCLSPEGRLWHPKVIVLMLESPRRETARTVFAIGSGNLTMSGWRKNLELFLVMEWSGWRLPSAVKHWISPSIGFAQDTKFGRWYVKNAGRGADVTVDRIIVSSYGKNSIWSQWNWDRPWKRACIVSPFTDIREEEQNDDPQSYFAEILEWAASSRSRLDVYLQAKPDGRVVGNWKTFKWLSQKIHLQVHRVEDKDNSRPLHAKLHAVQAGNTWHILGGSPNATSAAMLMGKDQSGNVELAWQSESDNLPHGLLPPASPVQLNKSNFIEPAKTSDIPRWRTISSISYDPKNKKLAPEWLSGHSELDTKILLRGERIRLNNQILLGDERAVTTLPTSMQEQGEFEADWVPIKFPYNESDDPVFERNMTLEQYISMLAGFEESENAGESSSSPADSAQAETRPKTGQDFPWHERVLSLELGLQNVMKRLDDSISTDETSHWLTIVRGCLDRAEPRQDDSDALEVSWKKWVRAEICYELLSWDKRKGIYRPFQKLAREWRKKIDPYLRRRM